MKHTFGTEVHQPVRITDAADLRRQFPKTKNQHQIPPGDLRTSNQESPRTRTTRTTPKTQRARKPKNEQREEPQPKHRKPIKETKTRDEPSKTSTQPNEEPNGVQANRRRKDRHVCQKIFGSRSRSFLAEKFLLCPSVFLTQKSQLSLASLAQILKNFQLFFNAFGGLESLVCAQFFCLADLWCRALIYGHTSCI